MVGSLLHLRTVIGALAGYGRDSEPILYTWELGFGARWPCGCAAVGLHPEYLRLAFCREHDRGTAESPSGRRNRRTSGERRQAPRRGTTDARERDRT